MGKKRKTSAKKKPAAKKRTKDQPRRTEDPKEQPFHVPPPTFKEKVKLAIENPERIIPRVMRVFHKYKWDEADKTKKKKYRTYGQYIRHQASSKLERVKPGNWIEGYVKNYRLVLKGRLEESKFVKPGMTALCLGARLGAEVQSFLDLGCFAVGVDINISKNNKYVVYGDFNDLQFADGSVDIIFTNAIDHAFEVDMLLNEVERVLKTKGYVVMDVAKGDVDGWEAAHFESFWWETVDDLLEIFYKRGFKLRNRKDFDYPWNGEYLVLSR